MDSILGILQAWFDEERGNRVTSNNFQMLVNKIGVAIEGSKDGNKVGEKQLQVGELGGDKPELRGEPVGRAQPEAVQPS